MGGENTDCVGCHDGEHTRAKMDGKHDEEPDYPLGAQRLPTSAWTATPMAGTKLRRTS